MFHGPSLAYTIERACACACEKERLGGPLPARCLPVACPLRRRRGRLAVTVGAAHSRAGSGGAYPMP